MQWFVDSGIEGYASGVLLLTSFLRTDLQVSDLTCIHFAAGAHGSLHLYSW